MDNKKFIFASDEDIKSGKTTDIYFIRTNKILKQSRLDSVKVYAEFTVSNFPKGYPWGFLGGLRDIIQLLEGLPINVYALPEGSLFYKYDYYGIKEPVLAIEGPYSAFSIFETPILGLLAHGSGVLTKTARLRKVAGNEVTILSFGARRVHPAIAPFVSYYAYIGGCDGVSCVKGAEFLKIKPMGTMPHSLMIIFKAIRGDHRKAWKAFDDIVEKDVPRIILVDTFYDEKTEAIMAVEKLGKKIYGIRLDTPSSRRGNFAEIIREVKWELKIRGYKNVKIIVSGGIDEDSIPGLIKAGADGFGIGSAISNAHPIDFAMDIVAVKKDNKWIPITKRGKLAGIKKVYRCEKHMVDIVKPLNEEPPRCPICKESMKEILKPIIINGKKVVSYDDPLKVREYVLRQLEKVNI